MIVLMDGVEHVGKTGVAVELTAVHALVSSTWFNFATKWPLLGYMRICSSWQVQIGRLHGNHDIWTPLLSLHIVVIVHFQSRLTCIYGRFAVLLLDFLYPVGIYTK